MRWSSEIEELLEKRSVPHQGRSKPRAAFTLVELLVVVSIIAILASLLLPTLAKAKSKVRDIVCVHNQRQINLALKSMWTSDEDRIWDRQREDKPIWFRESVGREANTWVCPKTRVVTNSSSATSGAIQVVGGVQGDLESTWSFSQMIQATGERLQWWGSYGLNSWVIPDSQHLERDAHVSSAAAALRGRYFEKEEHMTQPSSVPLTADCIAWVSQPTAEDPPPSNLQAGFDLRKDPFAHYGGLLFNMIPRHGISSSRLPDKRTRWPPAAPLPGAINVGFFDGHVEQTSLENLWSLHWHRNYEPPTVRPGLR